MISDFRACLQFCYNAILQKELYRVTRHWNTHKIRPYPNQDTPAGKPDVLFFLSEVTGKIDVFSAHIHLYKLPKTDVSERVFVECRKQVCFCSGSVLLWLKHHEHCEKHKQKSRVTFLTSLGVNV